MIPAAAEEAAEVAEVITGFGSEKILKEVQEPIYYNDFDEFATVSTRSYGFDSVEESIIFADEEADGLSLAMSTEQVVKVFREFERPIDKGKYVVSFDVKKSSLESSVIFMGFFTEDSQSDEKRWNMFAFQAGKIGYWSGVLNWTFAKSEAATADKWYHVMIWMDLDNNTMEYYLDNRYLGRASGPEKIYGFSFIHESANQAIVSHLDNVAMFESTPEGAGMLKRAGINVPASATNAVLPTATSEFPGNIFRGLDAELTVKHENKISREVEYSAQYNVKNYRGDIVWTGTRDNLKVGAFESFTDEISPRPGKYGIYTLECILTPKDDTVEPAVSNVEFTLVNAPTEGYKDMSVGINIDTRSRWEDGIGYIVDLLGVGGVRIDAGWAAFEREKGNYEGYKEGTAFKLNVDTVIQKCAELGIEPLLIFAPFNSIYGIEWGPMAQTEEQLKAYEEACYQVAKKYKGMISVELGNELNMSRKLDYLQNFKQQKAGYDGIKRGDPDMLVATQGGSRNPAEWYIEQFKAADGEPIADIIAWHHYQGQGSPESGMYRQIAETAKEEIKAKSGVDLPVWNTEGNTSSSWEYHTETQQGINLIRQYAQMKAYGFYERFYMYCLQVADLSITANEDNFGIIRGWTVDNAYGAKPGYVQLANYIAMTENTEFADDIVKDDIYAYRFKKSDGSYMVMMYADQLETELSLDLGASGGTLYDVYGNPQKLSAKDGKYTFAISDEPVYFHYSGDKFAECNDKFNIKNTQVAAPVGTTKIYEFEADKAAEILVEAPDNIYTEISRDGKEITIKATASSIPERPEYSERRQEHGTLLQRDKIRVSINENGQKSAYWDMSFDYLTSVANIEFYFKPYNNVKSNHLKAVIDVTNTSDKPLNGTVVMDSPEAMANLRPVQVKDLMPGKKGTYTITLPSTVDPFAKAGYRFSGRLKLNSGEELKFYYGHPTESYGYKEATGTVGDIYMLNHTGNVTPVIDGVIDEDEWADYLYTAFDKSQVSYGQEGLVVDGVVAQETFGADADYGGKSDFSGVIYAQWDEKYLYAAAVVQDDVHSADLHGLLQYLGDNFMIDSQAMATQRHDTRTNIAHNEFAGNTETKMITMWTPNIGIGCFGPIPFTEDGAQGKTVRKDLTTIYEMRIPWKYIIPEEDLGKTFIMTFGIRDYDGDRDKTFALGGPCILTNFKK